MLNIHIVVLNYMQNIRILASAALQILCSQGFIPNLNAYVKKGEQLNQKLWNMLRR